MVDVADLFACVDVDQDGHCFLILRFEGCDLKETPRRIDAFLIDAAGRPMSLAAFSRSLVKRAISIMRRSCLYENPICASHYPATTVTITGTIGGTLSFGFPTLAAATVPNTLPLHEEFE